MISVMFCEIEGLNPQTSKQDVMCIVECMNIIFSHFDNLTDRHDVYKVSVYIIRTYIFERTPTVNYINKIAKNIMSYASSYNIVLFTVA